MPKPTTQAQKTIEKLLAAGWKRNQFSVRTERVNFHKHPDTGKQCYEYGDVIISLRNSTKSEQRRKAKAMADQGLHVRLHQFSGGWAHPHVTDVYWLLPGIFVYWQNKDELERVYKGYMPKSTGYTAYEKIWQWLVSNKRQSFSSSYKQYTLFTSAKVSEILGISKSSAHNALIVLEANNQVSRYDRQKEGIIWENLLIDNKIR